MNFPSKSDVAAVIIEATRMRNKHPELRWGQALSNAAYTLDPARYDDLNGTGVDPFYLDDRVPAFLAAWADIDLERSR